jgi:hypothetical protein
LIQEESSEFISKNPTALNNWLINQGWQPSIMAKEKMKGVFSINYEAGVHFVLERK